MHLHPFSDYLKRFPEPPGKRAHGWLLAFHAVLAIGLLGSLAYTVASRYGIEQAWALFRERLAGVEPRYIWLPVLLMAPNWLLETAKWRLLLQTSHRVPFRRALEAVLGGLGPALVTPQRIGEYGGRLLLLPKPARWAGLYAKIVGNAAQMLVTLSIGTPAALFLGQRTGLLSPSFALGGLLAHALLIAPVLYLFFQPRVLRRLLTALPWPAWVIRYAQPAAVLTRFPPARMAAAFALATARYSVYSAQYLLLLPLFGIHLSFTDALMGVCALFWGQTMLPLGNLAGLAVRSNLAVWVWGHFGADPIAALSAALFLWIINLILPALFGTICLFRVQLIKYSTL